jgi:hypothetical protein
MLVCRICVCVCVYSVRNALVLSKKICQWIYHEKIRQNLSAVVPQLSSVLLRVRSPSCSLHSSCKIRRLLVFILILKFYEGGPFFR